MHVRVPAVLLLFLWSGLVHGSSWPERFRLSSEYEIYSGGFHIAALSLDVARLNQAEYQIRAAATARGVVGFFTRWRGSVAIEGMMQAPSSAFEAWAVQPRRFSSLYGLRRRMKQAEMEFDETGAIRWAKTAKGKTDRFERAEEPVEKQLLLEETSDAFSVLTRIVLDVNASQSCENLRYRIFDARHVHLFTLFGEERSEKKAQSFGLFRGGPVLSCLVRLENLTKPRPKKEETSKDTRPPVIWFGRLDQNSPLTIVHAVIPTRRGGRNLLYLTGWRLSAS